MAFLQDPGVLQQLQILQFLKIAIINGTTLALGGLFPIPGQAQPSKILPQSIGKILAGALGIQILHPQHDGATPALDRQPGDQKGKHIAQVHSARRRRRKSAHRLCIQGDASFFFYSTPYFHKKQAEKREGGTPLKNDDASQWQRGTDCHGRVAPSQ